MYAVVPLVDLIDTDRRISADRDDTFILVRSGIIRGFAAAFVNKPNVTNCTENI